MKTQDLDHLIADNPPCPVCSDCGDTIYSMEPFVTIGGEFFHESCYITAWASDDPTWGFFPDTMDAEDL